MPEWISVKERLPEDGESILMIVSGKPKDNITLIGVYAIGDYSDDEGWIVDEYPEWENPNVIYWMPLPEPPDEVEHGRN